MTATASPQTPQTSAGPEPLLASDHIDDRMLKHLAERVSAEGSGGDIEVLAPATGELLGRVPQGTAEDVARAATRARAAQQTWAARPVAERAEIFKRFHDLVLQRQDEAMDLVQLESGKARKHAFEEVLDAAITARYYANTAAGHLRSERRRGALPALTETWEHHRPRGLAGFIVPWNYPLTLGVSDAVPALLAGNGVVMKPDAETPFSALWAAELLDEAGLPDELFQLVTGKGSELGTPLIESVEYIMFTGSTKTGRTVARQAGENLIGCSMELGGKNAMIVLDDTDLDRAVEGAERAVFSNAGQLCISMERIYVHRSVYADFAARLAERAEAMTLGSALDYSTDMGSLVSADQLETVSSHVDEAVSKGATVLAGGQARPDIGPFFYEPTLLADVAEGMTVYTEETFGPVASLYPFDSVDEVVERANTTAYGLNYSVWTRDRRRGHELATRLDAGTVNVNEGYAAAWASTDAPMGGFKASGIGRRHGAEGIRKYTEAQTVATQRVLPMAPPGGMSQKRWGQAMTASLKLLRRLPGVR
jgi:succinate-semialdehyde dehydrogenase/glutarate-semialdehyde dehydrogenase